MKTSRPPAICFAAAIISYLVLWFLVPQAMFMRILGLICVCLPTIIFMAAQISMVYFFTKIRFSAMQALLIMLACVVGFVAIGRFAKPHGVALSTLFVSMLTIFAASSLGYLVSIRIKDKNLLLPVVMFAACIDFWTVSRGPVFHMIRHMPGLVSTLSAPIPTAGAGAFVPSTMVGPGDFVFMALVFAAVHRLGMNSRRNFWFIFTGMVLGMLLVLFGMVEKYTALPGLPALVVLAIAVISANWREFKLSRQEAISVAIVGLLLAISVPLVWWLLKPPTNVSFHPNKHVGASLRPGSRPSNM